MMRRTAALLAALALGGLLTACGDSNSNTNSNAARTNVNGVARDGVIDTNANIPANLNPRSVPSNTGVLVNNNGNDNTSGIRSINR